MAIYFSKVNNIRSIIQSFMSFPRTLPSHLSTQINTRPSYHFRWNLIVIITLFNRALPTIVNNN